MKKAVDVRILDIGQISTLADYFIIASGNNRNQVQAMADNVDEVLAKAGYQAKQTEGYRNANWILLDYGDVVIHLFDEENRLFYDLERIWRGGEEIRKRYAVGKGNPPVTVSMGRWSNDILLGKWGKYLEIKEIAFDTIDQQQAVFGMQDSFVKIIEKALPVTVSLREIPPGVEIKGDSEREVKLAGDVMISLRQMSTRGEKLNSDTVYRLLEDVQDGMLDETFQAMGNVVALNHKGMPIKCKTMGQKNYVKALRDNVVTICIGPAGTGKTYLAVAQAVKELKDGQIDRIIMSRPAIEAGEERLGFLPGDLAQKVDTVSAAAV